MNLLDDIEEVKKRDTIGNFDLFRQWPNKLRETFSRGRSIAIPSNIRFGKNSRVLKYHDTYSAICLCGMGGSAISGDFIASICSSLNFEVPVYVIRGYRLPSWVSPTNLVIAVSYSGDTRETLSSVQQALEQSIPVLLVSSGGFLKTLSTKFKIPWIELTAGLVPRAAFPVIIGALLGVFEALFPSLRFSSLIENIDAPILAVLDTYGPEVPMPLNKIKHLATRLTQRMPIVMTTEQAIGMRWKGQLNENSKVFAFYDVFPESMHNSIESWQNGRAKEFEFIVVKLKQDGTEMVEKMQNALALALPQTTITPTVLEFASESRLGDLLAAALTGDLLSVYLALLLGEDPSKTPLLTKIKTEFDLKLNQQFNPKKALLDL